MNLVEHLTSDAGYHTLLCMPSGDLNALCRTCKTTQLSATAFLYRHVELLFRIIRHSSMMHTQLDNFTDCYRRQRLFCETIIARPDLAPLVRKLSWTIDFPILPDKPPTSWEQPVLSNPDDDSPFMKLRYYYLQTGGPFRPPTDPFQSARPKNVWQTFLLLKNVKALDLRIHDQPTYASPFSSAPSDIFPNAHTVKLGGTCREEFVMAVISHNPTRIRHLVIDHLTLHNSGIVGWSALVKSALPSLISLTFRKKGAYSPKQPFDDAAERAAFRELAAALESVRESIRFICIGSTSAPQGCVVYGIRPGDTPVSQGNFEDLVLPT